MAKGWTVQVTTQDPGFRRDRLSFRLFDVAIEDPDKAVEAVRHHVWSRPDARVEAMAELNGSACLSPGRVRGR
jgi:hypothetical protein